MRYLFVLAAVAIGSVLCAQTTDELRRSFDALAGTHPTHVDVRDLPGIDNGSFYVSIRDKSVIETVPAVMLMGSLHGHETASGAACLQVARRLLEDKALRDQFSHSELIIIPVPNPGGRDGGFTGLPLRFDDDRDGKLDEDGPSDLNGDGVISQMRVKRAGGRYVISDNDPRLLIEAAPGEKGEYDLLWEGKDDDLDGRINEDAAGTVTLANDWGIRWSKEQTGANRFKMQAAETRALAQFLVNRPNLVAAFQLRGIGGEPVFAAGPKVLKEDPYKRDKEIVATLGKLWSQESGEVVESAIESPKEGAGNILDWWYEAHGAIAANIYLAPLPSPEKENDDEEEGDETEQKAPAKRAKPNKEEAAQLAWLSYKPRDFLEWKTFDHPQLGRVEIGGWKLGARSNPVDADVEAGAGRTAGFLKGVLESVPRLSVSKVEVEDKGGNLYRVRATVHNAGLLDYRSAFGATNRIGLPLFVSLTDTKDVELISGTRRHKHENIPAGETATFEWFVRVNGADSELEIAIESDRTGNLEHAVTVSDCDELKLREDEE